MPAAGSRKWALLTMAEKQKFAAEKPRFASWAPGEGNRCAPILAALRADGFLAQIGSRSQPPQNFEVRYLHEEAERATEIILDVDPAARRLTVGR